MSVVEPPGGTVAEERAKLVWACKRLLNGNKKSGQEYKTPEKGRLFSLNPGPPIKMAIRQSTRLAGRQSNPTRLNWIWPLLFTKEQSRKRGCLWGRRCAVRQSKFLGFWAIIRDDRIL